MGLRLMLRSASVLIAVAGSSGPAPRRSLVLDLHLHRHEEARDVRQPASKTTASERRLRKKSRRSYPCTLGNYDNVQYHLLIEIGNPCQKLVGEGQKFRVVPDTGSSDLWIPASNCTRCRGSAARFKVSKSCSAKTLGERITFRYGDGTTAAGVSLKDTVKVGDLEVKDQFFIQVDTMEATTHMQSDGILGLAHHYQKADNSDERGHTFMSTLFKRHPELPQMFSFYLTGKEEEPSKIVFGDPDLAKHSKEKEFKYGKGYYMSHTDLWLTSVYSIGWSRTGVEKTFPNRGILGSPALIDSGSSLIVLQPDIYDDLMGELQWRLGSCRTLEDQSIEMCNCPPAHDLNGIPHLVINIVDDENHAFPLCMAPDEYILQSVDPVSGMSTCVPALQRGSMEQPVPLIFGMTFMRAFYTNFDLKNHRIGFARSNMSPMSANAQCSVRAQPFLSEAIWLSSVLVALFSVCFACYVFVLPDKNPFAEMCSCCTCCAFGQDNKTASSDAVQASTSQKQLLAVEPEAQTSQRPPG